MRSRHPALDGVRRATAAALGASLAVMFSCERDTQGVNLEYRAAATASATGTVTANPAASELDALRAQLVPAYGAPLTSAEARRFRRQLKAGRAEPHPSRSKSACDCTPGDPLCSCE